MALPRAILGGEVNGGVRPPANNELAGDISTSVLLCSVDTSSGFRKCQYIYEKRNRGMIFNAEPF